MERTCRASNYGCVYFLTKINSQILGIYTVNGISGENANTMVQLFQNIPVLNE